MEVAVEKQGLCLRSDFGNVWAQLLSVHSPHTLQSLSLINPGFIRSHPAASGVPLHFSKGTVWELAAKKGLALKMKLLLLIPSEFFQVYQNTNRDFVLLQRS